MTSPKILVQLDSDPQPSLFDAVVAVDAGVDHLLQYRGVAPEAVRDLVHGAIFTRGLQDLQNTAVFVGGSQVSAGESLLKRVTDCFFGPMRVSVLFDASGANTTAAAAVLSAARHQPLTRSVALVLAATGPVGQRAVRLLAREGCEVRVASRNGARAEAVCREVETRVAGAKLTPVETSTPESVAAALPGAEIVIAAGAAGVQLLPAHNWQDSDSLRVVIDLNAVPPMGVAGVKVTDKATPYGRVLAYGAIGVGGLKMKIHKAAIARLFESNDQVLDAEEIYAIGQALTP
jgi:methylenetetrahydrofolate/methylenetetrahydromethanopterin dehydrogenase (NADP+)